MPAPLELATLAGKTITEQSMVIARASGSIFQRPDAPGPGRAIAVWGFRYVDDLCDDRRFDKAITGGLKSLRAFAGDGLFTAYTEEPNWGKAHRILLPAFSQRAMETYHPQMLDLASQLVLKWARLNPGETVDVAEDMTRLTLDTIGLCGFGYRFNSFYRTDLHPYVHGMVYTLDKATAQLMRGTTTEIPNDPELARYRSEMDAFVDEVIAARKAAGPDAEHANDLLGFMLTGVDKQTGEGLDDVTIRYEINTFLVAGHETTSGLLSFALYFLSKHPDVMARAQAEADRVFGTDPSVPPTYEQVRALAYIPQVLNESLRLWPTAPGFTRHPYEPDVLAGEYAIEPDDAFQVLLPMLHRDPEVWGPDAERFDPDNFAPEAAANRPPNAYKPFGTGQRSCIGRQFALQEAALLLGMIMQRFDVVDVDDYQLRIRQTLTIKPDGLRLAIRPREGRAVLALGAAPALAETAPAAATPAADPAARPVDGHGAPLLVLFGSNLGAAEDVAHRIANAGAARGFAVSVAPLDDYTGDLPSEGAVVVSTASYNGTPPDNAAKFCAWLSDPDLPADALDGVSYAVFGCGNHEWHATFQAIPRLIDEGLAAHGARRVYERGEGDAAADFDSQYTAWEAGLWDALAEALGLDPAAMAGTQGPLYTVERVSAPANPFLSLDGLRPFVVEANRELQNHDGPNPSERSTRHIEFALPEGASYQTGDHLGVIPRNGIGTIARVLARFGFAGDAYVRISRNGSGTEMLPLDRPVAVLELLNRYVDLQEVASRAQIGVLAEATTDPAERDALLALADETRYDEEILARRVSLIDLLERFPSCALPFDRYLEMLHPLRVRYYSISSSPALDPGVCSLTVAVVDAPARSGQGVYRGVASCYLANHPAGSVIDGYLRSPSIPFRPPADPTTPIIMVGPGTGLAPFRGFLQDRAAMLARGKPLGPAMLFFGCRNPEQDFIYRDELETFAAHGIVELITAFSRPDSGEKRYVQDEIRARGAEVWNLIERGAIIYVCGDGGKMEPAVRQALAEVATTHGGIAPDATAAWQADLRASGRYLADVWASG